MYRFIIISLIFLFLSGGYLYSQSTFSTDEYTEMLRMERKFDELEDLARENFENAMKDFNKDKYEEAGMKLKELVFLFPGFSRIAEATYYMGESFYKYGNYTESRDAFTRVVQKYPTSEFYPDSLYKLELIGFKQERYTEAIFYHQKILMEFPVADFIDAANYFGGICRYSIGEFDEAIDIMAKVNKESDYYAFSQYTMALCYLQRDDVEGAITQLNKIFDINTRGDVEKAIKDLTHVTLGRLYYEFGEFERALKEYDYVDSSDEENYDDAILGKGWVYIKQYEYDKALDMFKRIINGMPQSDLVAEAKLSTGHCYLGMGEYDKAIDVYKDIRENYSIAKEMEGDIRVSEIFHEIGMEMTRADELFYNLIELDKIALSQGREDLHRRIIQEKEEVQRIQDLLAGLEMWFSGRSTTGRNLLLGAEFGIATISFEKAQDLEKKILEMSEEINVEIAKLKEKQEELIAEAETEIILEKESDIGYRESLKGTEGVSILKSEPREYSTGSSIDFSSEQRIPVGLSEELEGITYRTQPGSEMYSGKYTEKEEGLKSSEDISKEEDKEDEKVEEETEIISDDEEIEETEVDVKTEDTSEGNEVGDVEEVSDESENTDIENGDSDEEDNDNTSSEDEEEDTSPE